MSVNLGETTATTLKNRHSEVVDNISNHNRLLRELRKQGKWQAADGGRTIDCPIDYVENANGKWFAGGQDSWSIPEQEVIDAATFDWKYFGSFVSYTIAEKTKNKGKHRAVNLMRSKIENMKRSAANTISTSVYSDGTGTSGLELGGVQLLVDDDPTSAGTVGGIDQNASTGAFWRNKYSASAATTASNIQDRMKAMWLDILRGEDKPGLIVADDDMFTYYWDSLDANQRYVDTNSADTLDAEGLRFQSAKVYYDDACPDKRMYFLNLNHLMFEYSSDNFFKVGSARQVTNAHYDVVPFTFVGNLTCSRRASQGVIIAS